MARKSHRDSAVRFVAVKSWPTYDLLRCYGQELARSSHQDSAVRFVAAKSWPERATETRQYDLLRARVGQKEPPKLGSSIFYGQELARKRHRDSAVRFVTAKRGPERATKTQPDRATETRQCDLLRPRIGQKEPLRLGSSICYGQTWVKKSHQESAVRFVAAKSWSERAAARLGSTICYGQDLTRKSHQDPAVRLVTVKRWPEQKKPPRLGQKEPPRLGNTICYGQIRAIKSHQDSAVRFDTNKRGPERAIEIRQYDFLRPRVGQK